MWLIRQILVFKGNWNGDNMITTTTPCGCGCGCACSACIFRCTVTDSEPCYCCWMLSAFYKMDNMLPVSAFFITQITSSLVFTQKSSLLKSPFSTCYNTMYNVCNVYIHLNFCSLETMFCFFFSISMCPNISISYTEKMFCDDIIFMTFVRFERPYSLLQVWMCVCVWVYAKKAS